MFEEKKPMCWLKRLNGFANIMRNLCLFDIDNDGVIKDNKRTVCDSTTLLYENMNEWICTLFILERDWIATYLIVLSPKCKDGKKIVINYKYDLVR